MHYLLMTRRPCDIPRIQIDTWGANNDASGSWSVDDLAIEICTHNKQMLVSSLLCKAKTLQEFAEAVDSAYMPLNVYIEGGQLYMHREWRVRYTDMNDTMRRMVIQLQGNVDLQCAFEKRHQPSELENLIYQAIGPAREEGTKCLRKFLRPQQAAHREE